MYDDITCLVLEIALIDYANGHSSSKIISINNNYSVDFSKLIQFNINQPTKTRSIKRIKI